MGNESETSSLSESLPFSNGEVLIKVAGGGMTVLCAEPAIRSFKSKAGSGVRLTVCGDGCDILRNHGDIDKVVLSSDRVEGQFDVVFELCGLGCDESATDMIERFALQLGVDLDDKSPRVSIDSFDHIDGLKFGMSELEHPRVAICMGFSGRPGSWEESKWNQLCTILEETLGSWIIQVGTAGNEFLGYGIDLIGKAGVREAATLLGRVDLLVSADADYAMLARAVDTPCVLLSECKEAVGAGSDVNVNQESEKPCEASVARVIDNIVELCGNSSGC